MVRINGTGCSRIGLPIGVILFIVKLDPSSFAVQNLHPQYGVERPGFFFQSFKPYRRKRPPALWEGKTWVVVSPSDYIGDWTENGQTPFRTQLPTPSYDGWHGREHQITHISDVSLLHRFYD